MPIKKRRIELGMTQEKLANKSGIPQSRISAYENGQIVPSLKTIIGLAVALECTPAHLIACQYGTAACRARV